MLLGIHREALIKEKRRSSRNKCPEASSIVQVPEVLVVITSVPSHITLRDVRSNEYRHRAALTTAGGRDTTRGHRRDAHGVKSAALAIFDRSLFVETATADRRRFLGEVWLNENFSSVAFRFEIGAFTVPFHLTAGSGPCSVAPGKWFRTDPTCRRERWPQTRPSLPRSSNDRGRHPPWREHGGSSSSRWSLP